jgi:hypothetical protein
MRRGRPRLAKAPPLDGPVPEEFQFLFQCKMALQSMKDGDDPPEDPEFIKDLLERYIDLADRPMTSPEIAAMVDWKAARLPSIAQAIEWVSPLVGKSIEAVTKDYQRHGKEREEIDADRAEYLRSMDEENKLMDLISSEEWEQARQDNLIDHERSMKERITRLEDQLQKAKDNYVWVMEVLLRDRTKG